MKILPGFGLLFLCAVLTGCGAFSNAGPSAPPPPQTGGESNDFIRAGDKITVRLTGVPDGDYLIEVQVPSSGQITVPLLTRNFTAVGRTPADVANEISQAYKTDQIYTNPHVTILPEERFVNVGGDVRGPARVNYTPDLTLLSTINSCGGFTEYADRHHVRIIRGKDRFEVDCTAAEKNPGLDPPVYPGDEIWVPRTPF